MLSVLESVQIVRRVCSVIHLDWTSLRDHLAQQDSTVHPRKPSILQALSMPRSRARKVITLTCKTESSSLIVFLALRPLPAKKKECLTQHLCHCVPKDSGASLVLKQDGQSPLETAFMVRAQLATIVQKEQLIRFHAQMANFQPKKVLGPQISVSHAHQVGSA